MICNFHRRVCYCPANVVRRVVAFQGICHYIIRFMHNKIFGQLFGQRHKKIKIPLNDSGINFGIRKAPVDAAWLAAKLPENSGGRV